jgi:hypothetical protein
MRERTLTLQLSIKRSEESVECRRHYLSGEASDIEAPENF